MDERLQSAVLEDLARAVDAWAETASTTLVEPEADLAWAEKDSPLFRLRGILPQEIRTELEAAMFEILRGLMHSALAVFDGATQSAEIGRVLITDESGEEFTGALHELFVEHLFATGRMT